jgi:uncharacterized iron-regulated membrane protein
MKIRKLFFWLHLGAGAVAGVVVLIMSVTGLLLAYERQVTAWSGGRYRSTPPSAGAAPLPVEALLAKIRESQHAAPSTITLRPDPDAAAEAGFGRDRTIFVDRYTGATLGEGSQKLRRFFRTITGWHRWLGAEGETREVARAVTGGSNLAFLFLVASGFYLWWPRKWAWQYLRPVTWFRGGITGRARDWNWHNVIGFWCAAPLFFIVLTAVVMSYPWANNLLYRMTGSEPARREGGRDGGPPAGSDPRGLDKLWARAEHQVSGWQSISVRLPASSAALVTFTIDQGNGGRPDKRAQLTLDRKTGAVVRWEPFSSYNSGRRLRTWVRWVHTGEAGGWIGQTVAAVASCGGAVLVWTGLALALRRFGAWWARKRPVEQFVASGTK